MWPIANVGPTAECYLGHHDAVTGVTIKSSNYELLSYNFMYILLSVAGIPFIEIWILFVFKHFMPGDELLCGDELHWLSSTAPHNNFARLGHKTLIFGTFKV